ncbi:MAG: TolC family protein [Treponemataceae bacterium]|nr:TolC family protein [Treponemataceae bacterium]
MPRTNKINELMKAKLTRFACVFSLLFVFQPGLFAQGTASKTEKIVLTVDSAVDYAVKNSKSLKSAAIDLEIKKKANAFSWNVLLPTANASLTMSRATEYPSYSSTASSSLYEGIYSGLAGAYDGLAGAYTALGVSNPAMATTMAAAAAGFTSAAEGYRSALDALSSTDYTEADRWSAVGNVSLQWNFNIAMIDSIRAAHVSYENGKITWEKTVDETKVNVKKLFYGLLIMQESLNIQKENLENAKARYEQASANYANGYVPELSVLNSQVSYENQKPAVMSAEQQLRQQKNMFAFLIGLPYGTEFELKGELSPEYISVNADELFRKYCNSNPEIISMRNNIKLLKISLNAQRLSAYTPSISVSYGWQPVIIDYQENWFDEENYFDNGSLSFTLVFSNLLNALPFGTNGQKIIEAKKQLEQAQIGLDTMIQNMEIEVHSLVDNLEKSQSNIKAMERNVELATKAYNSTLKAYNNGTQELLDVKDAENSMSQAKLGLMNEKYNYISAVLDLEQKINAKLDNKSGETENE